MTDQTFAGRVSLEHKKCSSLHLALPKLYWPNGKTAWLFLLIVKKVVGLSYKGQVYDSISV